MSFLLLPCCPINSDASLRFDRRRSSMAALTLAQQSSGASVTKTIEAALLRQPWTSSGAKGAENPPVDMKTPLCFIGDNTTCEYVIQWGNRRNEVWTVEWGRGGTSYYINQIKNFFNTILFAYAYFFESESIH